MLLRVLRTHRLDTKGELLTPEPGFVQSRATFPWKTAQVGAEQLPGVSLSLRTVLG